MCAAYTGVSRVSTDARAFCIFASRGEDGVLTTLRCYLIVLRRLWLYETPLVHLAPGAVTWRDHAVIPYHHSVRGMCRALP